MRTSIICKIAVTAGIIAATNACTPRDRYITFSGYAQGGTYSITLNLNGENGRIDVKPEEIRSHVDSLLQKIDNSLSGYNKNSLLSRFNAGENIMPDSIFIDIYDKAYDIYDKTIGVVDVASAPLFDIWGFGFKSGEVPSEEKIAEAMEASGMHRLRRDMVSAVADDGTLNWKSLLSDSGDTLSTVQLNYNAIAQGYSCDIVSEYLYSIGVKDMLVDIGEIYCDGKNPSGKAWTLGIDRPEDGNNERGASLQLIFYAPEGAHGIVTSGNYRKFYIRDGKKYAHTIDPRTGTPVSHSLLSATVIAPDGTLADTFATYCMVIGLEEAQKFIESHPELDACLIYDDNGTFRTWTSTGFLIQSSPVQ